MIRLNKILIIILSIIIISSIPIFYSVNSVTDAFSFWHMAFVQKFLYASHFPMFDQIYNANNIPGAISIVLILSKISQIPPSLLQFIPIVGVLLIGIYFITCREISNSIILSILATFLMINIPEPMTFFTIWPHAFGFFLFIVFTFLMVQYLKNFDIRWIILIILVYLAVHFYSYTVEAWLILFSVLISFIFFFYTRNLQISKKLFLNAFILFLIFLGFNQIFYEGYLAKGRFLNTITESTELFFNDYLNLNIQNREYMYNSANNSFTTISGFLYISISSAIIIFFLIFLIKEHFWNSRKYDERNIFLFITLFLIAIFDILIYAAIGTFQLRTIYIFFPILLIIALPILTTPKKTLLILSILSIIIFSHSLFSWTNEAYISNSNQYEFLKASSNWFFTNAIEYDALSDLRTGDKFLLEGIENNKFYINNIINYNHYSFIVDTSPSLTESKNLEKIARYLILNTYSNRIESLSWEYYKPFETFMPTINQNIFLNKIYSDPFISIFNL